MAKDSIFTDVNPIVDMKIGEEAVKAAEETTDTTIVTSTVTTDDTTGVTDIDATSGAEVEGTFPLDSKEDNVTAGSYEDRSQNPVV